MLRTLPALSALLLAFSLTAPAPNRVMAALTDPVSALPAAGQDAPQSLQIRVSSTRRTYSCGASGADAVQVTGSSDVLTITGDCGALQITGSNNAITIDSVESLDFTGNSNSVLYRRGPRPTSSDNGRGNTLGRAGNGAASADSRGSSGGDSAPPSRQSVTVTDGSGVGDAVSSALQAANAASAAAAATAGAINGVDIEEDAVNLQLANRHTVQDCGDGKNVNINGNENHITLTGSCNKIVLNGSGNTVHVDEVASIEVLGHTNTFLWKRGRNAARPNVQIDAGANNVVRRMAPPS